MVVHAKCYSYAFMQTNSCRCVMQIDSVYVLQWLSFPNDSFRLALFFSTFKNNRTTCRKMNSKTSKKNLLHIMLIHKHRANERRYGQRWKMNNYCAGTDFIKWNESFAAILAIIMRWWNAKTLEKNMSTNITYNAWCNTLYTVCCAVQCIYVSE